MKLAKFSLTAFRIGRGDPWKLYAPNNQNRFDISNPVEPVTTLYMGDSEESCFAEVLADFRPSLDVLVDISNMPCDPGSPMPASQLITKKWRQQRLVGSAQLRQDCQIIDVTDVETLQALRTILEIARLAKIVGFLDIDESALKASGRSGRIFTQKIASEIFNRNFDGIKYGSRLGAHYTCIAGFIPVSIGDVTESSVIRELYPSEVIQNDRPSLVNVARIFDLVIEE